MNDFGLGAEQSGQKGERGTNDYSVVFSPAVPLPPELLRECARYAGCHVWSDENAVIYANRNFVALHSAQSGEHILHLPRKMEVWDLNSSKRISKLTDTVRLMIKAPETRLLRLIDAK